MSDSISLETIQQNLIEWRIKAGQPVNLQSSLEFLLQNFSGITAQQKLIAEEGAELFEILAELEGFLLSRENLLNHINKENFSDSLNQLIVSATQDKLVNIAKELSDLLYVTFGMFTFLGLPIEECYQAVASNNDKKLQEGQLNADGKLVVPLKVKEALKDEIQVKLLAVIKQSTYFPIGDTNGNN